MILKIMKISSNLDPGFFLVENEALATVFPDSFYLQSDKIMGTRLKLPVIY